MIYYIAAFWSLTIPMRIPAGVLVIKLISKSSGHLITAAFHQVLNIPVQFMIKNVLICFVIVMFLVLSLEVFYIEKRHVNYFRDELRHVEEVLSLWDEQ